MRSALAGFVILLVIAGCGTAATTDVTSESPVNTPSTGAPVNVSSAVDSAEATTNGLPTNSAEITESTEPAVEWTREQTPEDDAACRLALSALNNSGLKILADRQIAGAEVLYPDVLKAGEQFMAETGGMPANASSAIQTSFIGLAVGLSQLTKVWTSKPDETTSDTLANGLLVFSQSVEILSETCAS